MAIDVWVSDSHPIYQVWVDGRVIDTLVMWPPDWSKHRGGAPLTWAQQKEIADNYREALSWEIEYETD